MEKLDNLLALDYLPHFLPLGYISNTIILETNHQAKKDPKWIDINTDELLHVLALLLAMEVYEIHGPRCFYLADSESLHFPSMNFGKIMSHTRFETILKFLQLLTADD